MKAEVKLQIYSADLTSELNLPYVDGGIISKHEGFQWIKRK